MSFSFKPPSLLPGYGLFGPAPTSALDDVVGSPDATFIPPAESDNPDAEAYAGITSGSVCRPTSRLRDEFFLAGTDDPDDQAAPEAAAKQDIPGAIDPARPPRSWTDEYLSYFQHVETLFARKDYREAERYLRGRLADVKKKYGEVSLPTAIMLTYLASPLMELHRYDEVEALYQTARKMKQDLFGAESAMQADCVYNLAHLYIQTGREAQGEACLHQAYELYFSASERHLREQTLTVLGYEVAHRTQRGDMVGLEETLRRTLHATRVIYGDEAVYVSHAFFQLYALYRGVGKSDKARELFQTCADQLGSNSLGMAAVHLNLAVIGLQDPDHVLYNEAARNIAVAERTVLDQDFENILGQNQILMKLTEVFFSLHLFERAATVARRASQLAARNQLYVQKMEADLVLATATFNLQKYQEAIAMLLPLEKLTERSANPEMRQRYQQVLFLLANAYQAVSDGPHAAQYAEKYNRLVQEQQAPAVPPLKRPPYNEPGEA